MKKPYSKQDIVDVSYNPRWTKAALKAAKPFAEVFPDLAKTIKRGRPPKAATKKQVTLRLSPDVLDHFKSGGPGWQTRIDDALRTAVRKKSRRVA